MTAHGSDVTHLGARHPHHGEVNRHEVLTHDVQARLGEKVVDVSDTSRNGVLYGDHGQVNVALGHRGEDIFKGGARQGVEAWIDLSAGGIGV